MSLLLWIFAATLVDRVYQRSSGTRLTLDSPTSFLYDQSIFPRLELLGERIQESPSFISEDDSLFMSLIAYKKDTEQERILKLRASVANEVRYGETPTHLRTKKLQYRSSAFANSSRTSNRRHERKLYECISNEIQVNTVTDSDQKCPFVMSLDQDKILVTWYSNFVTNSIRGQVLDLNLKPLGNEFQISSALIPSDTSHFSQALLLPNGYYAVLWLDTSDNIALAIVDDNSAVQSETTVNTSTSGDTYIRRACPSASGGFLVTWTRAISSTEQYIQGRIFDNSGSPQGDDFVIYSANNFVFWSSCSLLPNGNFIVTWDVYGNDGNEYEVLAQILNSSGTATGGTFSVNTYKQGIQNWPSVATLNNGDFVIVWNGNSRDFDDGYGIYSQLYNSAGVAIGDELHVNTYTTGDQYYPQVEALYDGGFLVIWNSNGQDGGNDGVYGQRYNASMSPEEQEFRINIQTDNFQYCSNANTIYNGFIVAWESVGQDGNGSGVFARTFHDSNTITNSGVCETCPSNQYAESNSCLDCREECSSCKNGNECESCNDSEASAPGCCNVNASISGNSCSVTTASEYFSGTECTKCEDDCGTCDSLGCLTCIISGIDCCSPFRVLQLDLITCDCPSECTTCDSIGCLSCSSGQECCPSSRYFDSDSSTCIECGSSDDKGCLSCPSGVSTCCPDGRFFDSITETCEDCTSPCKTCENSTKCSSCDSGSTCCGDGRYLDSDGLCKDCLNDCATCSDGSSCDICTDPNFEAPECCLNSTQDDSNKDGYCECLDDKTALSNCQCSSNEARYWIGTAYYCIGPFDIFSLTITGPSEIGLSCSEDLELFVTDFSDLPNNSINPIEFRWFSDSPSLAEYLRGQVSNPLSIPSADLPSGTTTFTVYMSVYGVIFPGTHSVTKTDDLPLTVSLSHELLTILSSDDTAVVKSTVSSQPCPSIAYSWTSNSSSRRLQLPDSSSDTLLIPSNTLPIDTFTYYTFSASSGSSSFSQSLVFYVTNPDLVAVIDPVGLYVSCSEDLSLNGGNSSDPSNDTEALSFHWSCAEIESGSCPLLSDTTSSQITIPSSELTSGMSFMIILSVWKGTRSSSDSVWLSVSPCGSSSTHAIDPSSDYTVALASDSSIIITSLVLESSSSHQSEMLQSSTISGNVIEAGTISLGMCNVYEAYFDGGSETVVIYGNKGPSCDDSSGVLPFVVSSSTGSISIEGCKDQDEFGSSLVYSLTVLKPNPNSEFTTVLENDNSNIGKYTFEETGDYDLTGIVCDSIGSCVIYNKVYTYSMSLLEQDKYVSASSFTVCFFFAAAISTAFVFYKGLKRHRSINQNSKIYQTP